MVVVSSWGRIAQWSHHITPLVNRHTVASQIKNCVPGLPFGMGRSYGDVCLNPEGYLWCTAGLDRFIRFDPKTGIIECEAGVLIRDIQKLTISQGWMLPVTPGTQMVTVGGAIANDVHGKNHHVYGTFGEHIQRLCVLRTNGEMIECSPTQKPQWFMATVGGLGLTGLILSAVIQLRRVNSSWIHQEKIPYANVDEFLTLADDSEADWEYTVSWIDCITRKAGQGIFIRGNHITIDQAQALSARLPASSQRSDPALLSHRCITFPMVPPVSLVNRLTLRPFNAAYFYLNKQSAGQTVVHYEPFFYPLDSLLAWNRMYGPKGFYQYQSLVPRTHGKAILQSMLHEIKRSGHGSFLAVLKTFGSRNPLGMLSFARSGITLALDFPNHGDQTLKLFNRLDAIVREAKGRIYLAKDMRMPRKWFEESHENLQTFLSYRDPGICSAMSKRLFGE